MPAASRREPADNAAAPLRTRVRPRRTQNGWMVESGSSSTSGSIQVEPGSTIATPASMCAWLIRSRRIAPAAAISTLVLPPSVSIVREAEAMGLPVISEIEYIARMVNLPIIAVTGSNGYVGSCIKNHFATRDWEILELVRQPRPGVRAGWIANKVLSCKWSSRA